jgi:hypothetical protein
VVLVGFLGQSAAEAVLRHQLEAPLAVMEIERRLGGLQVDRAVVKDFLQF